jgi:hypothetical protein
MDLSDPHITGLEDRITRLLARAVRAEAQRDEHARWRSLLADRLHETEIENAKVHAALAQVDRAEAAIRALKDKE